MIGAIIVAAGNSTRFGSDKLNQQILGATVLERAVLAFHGIAHQIIVVGDVDVCGAITVKGGATRSQSVQNGIKALSDDCDIVAIHDAARPFVSRELIQLLCSHAQQYGSAVPRLPVSETLWQQGDQLIRQNREEFFTVQTPQVFNAQQLRQAFAKANSTFTDESTLYHQVYGQVHFVDGQYSNKKITVPSDLPTYRIGTGFDVHPLVSGNGVILGGVKIPYDKKLQGHSDADVLAHAICDAILSASNNRDIGVQFPDTDPQYKGANSLNLLAQCLNLAHQGGYCVENVSAVVICQQPKISPYIPSMAQNLAQVLQIPASCVNLSATTTEHLGALGNGDGIAVQAQALLSQKH